MLSLDETMDALSAKLLSLDPGPLAELRRMESGRTGTPTFWRMAAAFDFPQDKQDIWMRIVKILAILTPRGGRSTRVRLNDDTRSLGAVFCDGGDPNWPPQGSRPAPKLSEQQFARLLATPANQRGEALERTARMLASSRNPEKGICCTDLARLLLYPADEQSLKRVARDYYARLDRVIRNLNKEGTH